ncbi:Rha family transcriptional regulator [Desulfonema magnum]|uniref:Phage regulatory protein, Rha family n=1 Tax=Desulfonema magnum TaxID=45655 RepID=A0A975GTG3_9BACT|nr:Rha family transcriptional regulator [Desulfonema magnum]QTA92113.1 Phage regulatory protein, Rha family [Desulfonema magnum]
MNENQQLVMVKEGRPVTTSLSVAEKFKKEHRNVLRDIRNLIDMDKNTELRFELSEYKDSTGRPLPIYIMDRDAFSILTMGFTGKKAFRWKLDYIAAFNAMEARLCQQAESKATGEVTGERFDLSVKRFEVALKAAKMMGITDNRQARLTANKITTDTTGVDLMGIVMGARPRTAESERTGTLPPNEEDEILTAFVIAWREKYGDKEVGTRDLYQLLADTKISLNLGTGSKRSQKIRLGNLLSGMSDREIGGCRIIAAGKRGNVRVWKLKSAETRPQM